MPVVSCQLSVVSCRLPVDAGRDIAAISPEYSNTAKRVTDSLYKFAPALNVTRSTRKLIPGKTCVLTFHYRNGDFEREHIRLSCASVRHQRYPQAANRRNRHGGVQLDTVAASEIGFHVLTAQRSISVPMPDLDIYDTVGLLQALAFGSNI
jgi:hypothetical protein